MWNHRQPHWSNSGAKRTLHVSPGFFTLSSLSWDFQGQVALMVPRHLEVKRLPGYRSGLNWVRQRKAALEDAMHQGLEGR